MLICKFYKLVCCKKKSPLHAPPPHSRCYVPVMSVIIKIYMLYLFVCCCSSRTQQGEVSARDRRPKEMLRATWDRTLCRLWWHETRQLPKHELLNSLFYKMIIISLLHIMDFFFYIFKYDMTSNADFWRKIKCNIYCTYVTYKFCT